MQEVQQTTEANHSFLFFNLFFIFYFLPHFLFFFFFLLSYLLFFFLFSLYVFFSFFIVPIFPFIFFNSFFFTEIYIWKCIYILKILFIFREREREGQREGKKHHHVVAYSMSPTGDLACNPSMCVTGNQISDLLASRPALSP